MVCFTFYDHWNSMGRWIDDGFFLLGSRESVWLKTSRGSKEEGLRALDPFLLKTCQSNPKLWGIRICSSKSGWWLWWFPKNFSIFIPTWGLGKITTFDSYFSGWVETTS